MSKYLYGASVQGIQSFIFQTDKLQEIIGASELVEQICTSFFQKWCPAFNDANLILGAAGNIKYVFDSEQDCKELVFSFPKEVTRMAPGITLSQAVVKFEEEQNIPISELERRLKVQRNIPSMPSEIGFMGLARARRTGGVGYRNHKKRKGGQEVICEATSLKRAASGRSGSSKNSLFEKLSGLAHVNGEQLPFDIEEITKSGKNSWIAVIHADGNGLGNIIQKKGSELSAKGKFSSFSNAIEKSTRLAANDAFGLLKDTNLDKYRYPIRPVVIGGDDLTLIIRADLALEFTRKFLIQFEHYSAQEFLNIGLGGYTGGLTACAGIAFVKESYPLHYAMQLAEDLCKDAKKKVKHTTSKPKYGDVPKSALAFYKVQDSFVKDFTELKKRTLTTSDGINFYFGPYLLEDLDELVSLLGVLNERAEVELDGKVVGKLRQLITECYRDKSLALLMFKRIKEINNNLYNDLNLDREKERIELGRPSQLLDLITLHSFNYGNKEINV